MLILYSFFIVLELLVGIHLVFPLILYALYKYRRVPPIIPTQTGTEADYALIVTAYQQTHQLPDVIDSLLRLHYSRFHIYVVADNCDASDWSMVHPRVTVLRPETVLASNTKSHFYAIRRFIRAHERLVIIDSDNVVDPDLLLHLNAAFNQGFQAVQGIREAKNLNTDLARLDAARDIYYHFYDGKLLFGAGSSATLAGSGMAFRVALYEQCLGHLTIEGAGFDKVLQAEILKRGYRIAFAPKAIVYDEKTTGAQQLVGQRARWINTWFRYFTFGFALLGKGIRRGDWNQFLFGIVLLRPPLFLFLAASMIFAGVNLAFAPGIALLWLVGLALFVLGFLLALRQSPTDPRIYSALYKIPRFMFLQIIALFNARNANQRSVATHHGEAERTQM
ncbi:glycosyltransferase [Salmonirosea aquatica]|uniref:Glycosyltransferase n=1 Tax=Salmonirosea aquatica TaxID=2654236 RepID=A0A7C9BDH1_9BACT|nr:glycosyltransferase [Cytophagaceae bacterium SJW1-29]